MADFKLDGTEYSFVPFDDLDLDELVLFRRMSGFSIDEVMERIHHFEPGITKALLVLSIQRAKSRTSLREIEERVGKLKPSEFDELFIEEEQSPPEQSASEPSSGELGASNSSNSDEPSAATQESETPENSGAQDLDTGFRSFHAMSGT